jgi:hypothetical protein
VFLTSCVISAVCADTVVVMMAANAISSVLFIMLVCFSDTQKYSKTSKLSLFFTQINKNVQFFILFFIFFRLKFGFDNKN